MRIPGPIIPPRATSLRVLLTAAVILLGFGTGAVAESRPPFTHPVNCVPCLKDAAHSRKKSVSLMPIACRVARMVGQVPSPTPMGGKPGASTKVIHRPDSPRSGNRAARTHGGDPACRAAADDQYASNRLRLNRWRHLPPRHPAQASLPRAADSCAPPVRRHARWRPFGSTSTPDIHGRAVPPIAPRRAP